MRRLVLDPLGWLARRGTEALALSLLAGIALPQLASLARPFLGICVFTFVTLTLIRVDPAALGRLVRRPAVWLACTAFLALAPPALVGAGLAVTGRAGLDPGLLLGVALLAAAPPMMSAPAIAMLLGIDATLVVAAVLALTMLTPITAPAIAGLVAGAAVPLDAGLLARRLVLLLGGAVMAAGFLRWCLGAARIGAERASLDGLAVVMYLVFAVAAMDGVLAAILAEPLLVLRLLGLAVAISVSGFVLSWLVLRRVPRAERLVVGYATGQRNMGLLIAALGSNTPRTTFLFFALAQVPIYIWPHLIRPFASRFREASS